MWSSSKPGKETHHAGILGHHIAPCLAQWAQKAGVLQPGDAPRLSAILLRTPNGTAFFVMELNAGTPAEVRVLLCPPMQWALPGGTGKVMKGSQHWICSRLDREQQLPATR